MRSFQRPRDRRLRGRRERVVKQPTLQQIAERICAHLKRFEADPVINRHREYDKEKKEWVDLPIGEKQKGMGTYYNPNAYGSGAKLFIRYISFQGSGRSMTKAEGLEYLAWLDAGNVGTHREWEKSKK